MTLRQMYKEDKKRAQVLDDILDAFGLLRPNEEHSAKTHYLVHSYIVRSHFRRRRFKNVIPIRHQRAS